MKTILFAIFAQIFLFGSIVTAQSALDGFDPNANDAVRAIVVQPDGKILIGGDFTTAGQTVVVGVSSKRHQFEPRVLTVSEDLTDFDFLPIGVKLKVK